MVVGFIVVVVSMDIVPGAVVLGAVLLLSVRVNIHSVGNCRAGVY